MDLEYNEEDYRKHKFRVKSWENKFKKLKNRNPTKDDIKSAPSKVKEAYKMYWLLKTLALEECILDDEEDESFKKSQSIEPLQTINQSSKESEELPLPDTPELIPVKPSASVWGTHLNKPLPKEETKFKKSTSFNFSEKLFKGSNFKIRNPRKTLLLNRSKSSDSLSTNENSQSISDSSSSQGNESIPAEVDLNLSENIKVTAGPVFENIQPINILQKTDDLVLPIAKPKIDSGWLERCNQSCTIIKVDENSTQSSDEDYIYSSDDDSTSKTINLTQKILHNLEQKSNNVGKESIAKSPTKPTEAVNLEPKSVNREVSEKEPKVVPIYKSKQVPLTSITDLINAIPNTSKRGPTEDLPRATKKFKTNSSDQDRKERILREKVASGKANENFVSLNMKKKIYVRGKKTMTGAKYKKQQWKMKKKMQNSFSGRDSETVKVLKCFKCGDVGHFSKQCQNNNNLIPKEDIDDEEECPFPTLEEAEEMVKEKAKLKVSKMAETPAEECIDFVEPADDTSERIPPVYKTDDIIIETPSEVHQVLHDFGYESFRPGQETAIMRILCGKSTLFISSTGSGKSLCYQIPAYLYAKKYRCISLVISPLVSLMEDQVLNFPKILSAACLHTNQTEIQQKQIIEKIQQNEIAVLLVSPEAVVSSNGLFGRMFMKDFPPIAFACIDEVHCVSQWSHNFRTSYLMICKILKERFNVHTLLGLTATATSSTISCIREHLGIQNEDEGVIKDKILPDNLILSVSKDRNRDKALTTLLQSAPFCDYKSIIIYCIRRNECERIAAMLRTFLKDVNTQPLNQIRRTTSPDVEEYHAGLSAARRKRVQKAFMADKLRIVVATVAFGMGINKSNIRGIIHYNMPPTYEHYVQEIGRAGRDGLPARCHLFLDLEGSDLPELRRHIYANSVDRPIIRKLLQNVFTKCSCSETCTMHEVAFSVEDTIKLLDLSQENITTLLCYLELLPDKVVQVLPCAYVTCTVQSYGGIRALKKAAKKCPPLAYAIAEHFKVNGEVSGKLDFSVVELADRIGWRSGSVKKELKQCEWTEVNGKPKKSGIIVNFHNLGFHVKCCGNLPGSKMDNALNTLYSFVQSQERKALYQLETCHDTFHSFGFINVEDCFKNENEINSRSENLKELVRKYFIDEIPDAEPMPYEPDPSNEIVLTCNIIRLISSYKDYKFTGRSIARILHGIESPKFPATFWSKSPFWRSGLQEDFNYICCLANKELIKCR